MERFHRTLLDEHFGVEGRRTWFETINEMQVALENTSPRTIANAPPTSRHERAHNLAGVPGRFARRSQTSKITAQEERKAA